MTQHTVVKFAQKYLLSRLQLIVANSLSCSIKGLLNSPPKTAFWYCCNLFMNQVYQLLIFIKAHSADHTF